MWCKCGNLSPIHIRARHSKTKRLRIFFFCTHECKEQRFPGLKADGWVEEPGEGLTGHDVFRPILPYTVH
jgi:hypothetical protein